MRVNASRFLRGVALLGAVVVAICVGRAAGVAVVALMLAPAVVVPLGLAIALARDESDKVREAHPLPRRIVLAVAPLGALAGPLGWLAPTAHRIAIILAVVHAAVCASAGLLALSRLFARRKALFGPLDEFAIDVGLLFLPAAAVPFVATRAGVPFAGFQEPVVLFTAAHFHFAGFAAPVVLGGVGRLLLAKENPPRVLYRIATTTVCAGVPLTAIGIATNHTVESVSAVALACGMLCASVMLVGFATRRAWPRSRGAAVLFGIAGVALVGTMGLAATFALTSSAGRGSTLTGAIPLQTMIDLHGGGNALGFALSGIVALSFLDVRPRGS
jgi:hypothetical protein